MTNFFVKKSNRIQRISWIIILTLWICLIPSPVFVSAESKLNMYAKSYALTDGWTNRLLVGKSEKEPLANASTTKILTCIIALENTDLEEKVTIRKNAAMQPKVRWGLQEGEIIKMKDLLYGLMLESYNDCAVAIAEHIGGSEEGFALLMNQKAKEIGCCDTYFVTANGLDKETEQGFHHTTAYDLCKIMAYCAWESPKKDEFLKITRTAQYGDFYNKNALLKQMDGLLSGKTGFTAKAGYCYVAAYEKNGKRFCIVLLACGWPNNKHYKWHDAKLLLNFAKENYSLYQSKRKTVHKFIFVDGFEGRSDFLSLNKKSKIELCGSKQQEYLLMADHEKMHESIVLKPNIKLPLEKNRILGRYDLYVEDTLIESIPLKCKETCVAWDFESIFFVILRQFFDLK